jgi:hypothetical protein
MLETVNKLLIQSIEILNKSISHSEYGPQNDFSEANDIKNQIVEYHIKILNEIKTLPNILPNSVVLNYTNIISSHISNINSQTLNIDKIIKQGIHNPDYPNARNNCISEFIRFRDNFIKVLYDIDSSIRFEKLINDLNDTNSLQSTINTYKENLSKLKENFEESKSILGDIRDLSFVKSLKESAGTFDKLRINHSKYERNWFISFISFSAILILAVTYILNSDHSYQNFSEIILLIIKKILIITIPIVGMRISLKKYNLERNLKIIYDHRVTVLEQYKYFENAIGDDKEAKNIFRLEVAKYIFSDPLTGYISDNSSPEVSVNPIISIAEKLITK